MRGKSLLMKAAFVIIDPIDFVYRLFAGRTHLPPFSMRAKTTPRSQTVGGAGWIWIGNQMVKELRTLCQLRPDEDVLEIGCACGIAAMPLRSYLTTGSYTGIDIIPEYIVWCNRHLGDDRFRFVHQNVHHEMYNPSGTSDSIKTRLPFEDGSFDVVFLLSVLTHMLPPTARHYFHEIRRVLRPTGRCLASMLTLERYKPGTSTIPLPHKYTDECICWDPRNLTRGVAFSEKLIARFARESGLRQLKMFPGNWDGITRAVNAHDMYVFGRSPS